MHRETTTFFGGFKATETASPRHENNQPLPDMLFDPSVATLMKDTRKKIMSCFILVH